MIMPQFEVHGITDISLASILPKIKDIPLLITEETQKKSHFATLAPKNWVKL